LASQWLPIFWSGKGWHEPNRPLVLFFHFSI
jgi:hypothetical protein